MYCELQTFATMTGGFQTPESCVEPGPQAKNSYFEKKHSSVSLKCHMLGHFTVCKAHPLSFAECAVLPPCPAPLSTWVLTILPSVGRRGRRIGVGDPEWLRQSSQLGVGGWHPAHPTILGSSLSLLPTAYHLPVSYK